MARRKKKRTTRKVTNIFNDLEEELCLIELEMISEALERAEKRKTDYIR